MIVVTVLIMTNIGWDRLVEAVAKHHGAGGFNPFVNPAMGWSYVLFNLLLNTAACLTWQATIARILASKDSRTGQRVYKGTAFFFVCRFMIPGLWGIAALATLGPAVAGENTLHAMPKFLSTFLPMGMMGLLVAAMLAADMSTDSSYMLTWGSVIYNDLLAPFRKRAWDQRKGLLVNRAIIAGIGIFLLFYGLWYPLKGDLWTYLGVTGTIYLSSMTTLVIACCYWKRANNWGAAAAIAVGSRRAGGLPGAGTNPCHGSVHQEDRALLLGHRHLRAGRPGDGRRLVAQAGFGRSASYETQLLTRDTTMKEHWFWWLMMLAVLVWYSTVTLYIAVREAPWTSATCCDGSPNGPTDASEKSRSGSNPPRQHDVPATGARALAGQPVPRVPTGPLAVHYCAGVAGCTLRQYTTNARVLADSVIRYYERFRPDAVWLSADTWVSAEAMGARVGATDDNQPFGGIGEPLVATAADIQHIPAPNVGSQGRYPLMLEALSRIIEALGKEVFIVACFDQYPFSLAAALMGINEIMLKIVDDPPVCGGTDGPLRRIPVCLCLRAGRGGRRHAQRWRFSRRAHRPRPLLANRSSPLKRARSSDSRLPLASPFRSTFAATPPLFFQAWPPQEPTFSRSITRWICEKPVAMWGQTWPCGEISIRSGCWLKERSPTSSTLCVTRWRPWSPQVPRDSY